MSFPHVSEMTLLTPVLFTAGDPDAQKCRYNWHYEEAMGLQAKEYQGLGVGWYEGGKPETEYHFWPVYLPQVGFTTLIVILICELLTKS